MHIGNRVDSFCCVEYSAAVFFDHLRLNGFTVYQSMDGSALRNGRGAIYQILIDVLNRSDDKIRGDDVADSPAGHREVFGERI